MEIVLVALFFLAISTVWTKLKQGGGEVEKPTMQLSSGEGYHSSDQWIDVSCPHCQRSLYIEEEGNWYCDNCKGDFVYFKNTTYKQEKIHSIFAVYIISILAKYCKLDGMVTKSELVIVENNIHSFLQATSEQMTGLKRIFNMESQNVDDYEIIMDRLSELVKEDPARRQSIGQFLSETMFQIGIFDENKQDIHLKHQEVIFKVTGIFNVGMEFYESLRKKYVKGLDDSYDILECKRNATAEEIKRKYRELSKKYHPDILASKDLSPEIIELASNKFKEINEAYRTIMQNLKDENRA